jgi:peptide/nickel transport system substrate-binding protein
MWSITFVALNFTNPTSGPLFSQPYFRQALQHLVDQRTYISKAFNGFAVAVSGPVPTKPPNAFGARAAATDPYPFDVGAATALLQSHGWTVNPGGVSACANPGTAANQCGAGVGAGAPATLRLEFAGGIPALRVEMAQLKADFAKAGIAVMLNEAPFNTVIGNAVPCVSGQACKWDMAFWGGGWVYAPDYYPTGDEIFSTGAGSNAGGYSNPNNDQLTAAAQTSNSTDALRAYADNLAKELPVLWLPTQDYQVSAITSHLKGALPQDALLQIYPETWSWS